MSDGRSSFGLWLPRHRGVRLLHRCRGSFRRALSLGGSAGPTVVRVAQKKGCRDIASCKAYIKDFVSQWLEQHGARAKTAVALRKHAIDADCGVRQNVTWYCGLRATSLILLSTISHERGRRERSPSSVLM